MANTAKHEIPVSTGSREHRKPRPGIESALRQPYEAFEQFMENMLTREWWPRAVR